jgi:hypothetical protein
MKQHLRINEFYGTSENAVKIQIYCAIITYCLVGIIESDLELGMSIYDVLRILNVSLFDKSRLRLLFEGVEQEDYYQNDTQLKLNLLLMPFGQVDFPTISFNPTGSTSTACCINL